MPTDKIYCIINKDGNLVRNRIIRRQAVAFCIRYPRCGYGVAHRSDRSVRLVTWVSDLSKY